MLGKEGDPGIMYLTTMELYRRLEARQEEKKFEVLISYLEVGLLPLWPTSYFILRTPEEGLEWDLGKKFQGTHIAQSEALWKENLSSLLLSSDITCKVLLLGLVSQHQFN